MIMRRETVIVWSDRFGFISVRNKEKSILSVSESFPYVEMLPSGWLPVKCKPAAFQRMRYLMTAKPPNTCIAIPGRPMLMSCMAAVRLPVIAHSNNDPTN